MRRIFIVASLAMGSLAFAQAGKIGINEAAPEATLDIKPNTDNAAESAKTNEGILIPRLTKTRVGNIDPVNRREGTLVYVTDDVLATDNATFTGTGKGFYYYDETAARWIKVGAGSGSATADNLYTADGTLTSARTVTQNNQNLTFKTGDNGKMIVEGNQQNKGAVYVDNTTSLRVDNGSTAVTYMPTDYMLILTNTSLSGNLKLPSAKLNTGRVIYLINGTTSGINFSNTVTVDDGPFNYTVLPAKGSSGFVSNGTTWYTIGR